VERITGTVTRANDHGFQLAGREGWLNVSKYAEGVAVPPMGATVAIDLDKSGFVRRVETAGGLDAPADAAPVGVSREATITRLALLNTATAILGGGPGHPVDPAEVVKLATRLEPWAIRATS